MNLSFKALRQAGAKRLPMFKNSRGEPAHTSVDGSCWSPAEWLQALVGEIGEFARARIRFENGDLTFEQYEIEAGKELADIQCYLDVLARRSLDDVASTPLVPSDAQLFMEAVASLGEYANTRKKFRRGDIDQARFIPLAGPSLAYAKTHISLLLESIGGDGGRDIREGVSNSHAGGVCLASATISKFNEVSLRMGCPVRLHDSDERALEDFDASLSSDAAEIVEAVLKDIDDSIVAEYAGVSEAEARKTMDAPVGPEFASRATEKLAGWGAPT